ncbi:MAG: ribonuclease III [Pseudomonadota bacterium]
MAARGAALAEGMAAVLGHRFVRPEFLAEALTHPSAASTARSDNQRLEFLGDRVLGLVIAEALVQRFPEEAEGTLAPRLNALVRRETLAEVAGELGLGQHLHLGRSESLSGGRRKAAILADAMEAVIAALYLDGGLPAAQAFIHRHWRKRIDTPSEAPTDAKTRLQEWAQGRGMTPPSYTALDRTGPDHAPVFTVEVRLDSGAAAKAADSSKKKAEQAAAARLLDQIGSSGA